MKNTAIIPDSYDNPQVSHLSLPPHHPIPARARLTDIILIPPLEPDLQVMIPIHQLDEPIEQIPALHLGETVDMLHMATDREDTLPTRDRISAHDRMDGLELAPDILRRAAGLLVEREAAPRGDFVEGWLRECGGQALQEALVRLADSVVELIAGCPEGICFWTSALLLSEARSNQHPKRTSTGPRQLGQSE